MESRVDEKGASQGDDRRAEPVRFHAGEPDLGKSGGPRTESTKTVEAVWSVLLLSHQTSIL
jgi:hypothetical protein